MAYVETDPLPIPLETAEGLYLLFRTDQTLSHAGAFAAGVQELLRLFPGLTPLQANLVMVKAARSAREREEAASMFK